MARTYGYSVTEHGDTDSDRQSEQGDSEAEDVALGHLHYVPLRLQRAESHSATTNPTAAATLPLGWRVGELPLVANNKPTGTPPLGDYSAETLAGNHDVPEASTSGPRPRGWSHATAREGPQAPPLEEAIVRPGHVLLPHRTIDINRLAVAPDVDKIVWDDAKYSRNQRPVNQLAYRYFAASIKTHSSRAPVYGSEKSNSRDSHDQFLVRTCLQCGKSHGRAENCYGVTCTACGTRGSHRSWDCPFFQTPACRRCDQRITHGKNFCPIDTPEARCINCPKTAKHLHERCPRIWRVYCRPKVVDEIATVVGNFTSRSMSCSCCGRAHYYDKCPVRFTDRELQTPWNDLPLEKRQASIVEKIATSSNPDGSGGFSGLRGEPKFEVVPIASGDSCDTEQGFDNDSFDSENSRDSSGSDGGDFERTCKALQARQAAAKHKATQKKNAKVSKSSSGPNMSLREEFEQVHGEQQQRPNALRRHGGGEAPSSNAANRAGKTLRRSGGWSKPHRQYQQHQHQHQNQHQQHEDRQMSPQTHRSLPRQGSLAPSRETQRTEALQIPPRKDRSAENPQQQPQPQWPPSSSHRDEAYYHDRQRDTKNHNGAEFAAQGSYSQARYHGGYPGVVQNDLRVGQLSAAPAPSHSASQSGGENQKPFYNRRHNE